MQWHLFNARKDDAYPGMEMFEERSGLLDIMDAFSNSYLQCFLVKLSVFCNQEVRSITIQGIKNLIIYPVVVISFHKAQLGELGGTWLWWIL